MTFQFHNTSQTHKHGCINPSTIFICIIHQGYKQAGSYGLGGLIIIHFHLTGFPASLVILQVHSYLTVKHTSISNKTSSKINFTISATFPLKHLLKFSHAKYTQCHSFIQLISNKIHKTCTYFFNQHGLRTKTTLFAVAQFCQFSKFFDFVKVVNLS